MQSKRQLQVYLRHLVLLWNLNKFDSMANENHWICRALPVSREKRGSFSISSLMEDAKLSIAKLSYAKLSLNKLYLKSYISKSSFKICQACETLPIPTFWEQTWRNTKTKLSKMMDLHFLLGWSVESLLQTWFGTSTLTYS